MFTNIINTFIKPENNKKIGLFRIITAIFGGLISSYLGVTALALILPLDMGDTSVIALLFNTLVWAVFIIWISLSSTKLIALLRFIIPTFIFGITIYFLY